MKKNRLFNAALILLAFSLTCVFIAFGAYFRVDQEVYGISVNLPSPVSIRAPRNIQNYRATERNRQDAIRRANAQPTIRTLDPQTWPLVVEHNLNILAENLTAIREFYTTEIESFEQAKENLKEALILFFESCLSRGTLEEVLRRAGYSVGQIRTIAEAAQPYIAKLAKQSECRV